MKRPETTAIMLSLACLVCVAVLWIRLDELGGSEFGGGRVTGRLFESGDFGSVGFGVGWVLAFFRRRIAALFVLLACFLTAPIYLFFLSPGLFVWIFGGEWKGSYPRFFAWNYWAASGILSLLVAACVSVRMLYTLPSDPSPLGNRTHGDD